MVKEFKRAMMKEYEMTDLGLMRNFPSIQVKQSKGEIFISQGKYIEDLLKKFHMSNCKIMHELNKLHYAAAKRILRYFQGTKNLSIRWNCEVSGNIDEQLKQAEAEHHDWDIKAEGTNLLEHEVKRRREVRRLVWELNKKNEWLWHQKTRLTWIANGDKNTRFFHILASSRQRKNLLDSIKENGVIYEQPDVMKQTVVRYFSQLFSEDWKIRPKLSSAFVIIGPKDSELLEAEFSEEEI
ncbi:uncharacterized protein LOC114258954 [Camellia sinensis]|uniref:uncharacterized protein LOC114258954 n=1 Tax=Camellia sinensis TaxID=4442 RepID=UPI001036CB20|nr:uncharacterized protein LOC114258954 [Camellia sinensis]